jgi:2-oxoisovalerate dehydrogenase E1 component alpha subunit
MTWKMATKLREPSQVTPNFGQSNPLISREKLRQLYTMMVKCRLLEERVRILEKQAGIESHPNSSAGGEATAVGAAIDLRPADTIAPPHGDLIVSYVKGLPLPTMLSQFYRRNTRPEIGQSTPNETEYARLNIVPAASNVAAQLEVCMGIAFANQRKKNDNIVMAFSGKGAMPLKVWRDALCFAGQRSLPVVFVRQSRSSGESGSVNFENADDEGSSEAVEYGFPAIAVDGNDVVAVYRVAQEAIERARSGGNPTLIEAQISPGQLHSLSDGAQEQAEQETDQIRPNDPIIFMERYLKRKGLFSQRWKQEIVSAFQQELDALVKPLTMVLAK